MAELQRLQVPKEAVIFLLLTLGISRDQIREIHKGCNLEKSVNDYLLKIKKSSMHESDYIGKEYLEYLISKENEGFIDCRNTTFDAEWVRDEQLHILNMSKNSDAINCDGMGMENAWRLERCEARDKWLGNLSKKLICENSLNILIMLTDEIEERPRWNILDLCGYKNGSYEGAFRLLSALAILGLNYRNKQNPELSSTLRDLIENADVFSGRCYKGDDKAVENYGFSRNQVVFVKEKNFHEANSRLFHLNFEKPQPLMKEWVVRDKLGDYDEVIKTLLIPLSLTSGTLIRLKLNPIDGVLSSRLRFLLPKEWVKLFKKGQAENRGKGAETPFKQRKHGDELDDIYFPAPQDLKDLKSLLRR